MVLKEIVPEEEQEPQDYVRLKDINIVTQMDKSTMQSERENTKEDWTNYQYNLHPGPRRKQYTFAESKNQYTISQPKTNSHVLLMQ